MATKFTSGAQFLKPLLEGHNELVDELSGTLQTVAGSSGINLIKSGKSVGISLDGKLPQFRFGIVRQAFYRGTEAIVQLCEYGGTEWQGTGELRVATSDFITGYYFMGMPVRLLEIPQTSTLQIMSEGVSYARFMIEEDLVEDGSVNSYPVDYPNGEDDDYPEGINDVELYESWGGTTVERTDETDPNGINVGTEEDPTYIVPKRLGCFWNDGLLRWEAGLERCS